MALIKTMKIIFSLLLLFLMANAGFSQAKNTVKYAVVTFEVKNMGINTSGTIGGLQTEIQFNPLNLPASKIEASVDVNTINTDNDSRDEHLKGEDFFDVAHYPKITLSSLSFKLKSGSNYAGVFDLSIKGKSKQVEIPFAFNYKDSDLAFNGTFKINRIDFGVGENSLVLSNEITINIKAETSK